MVKAILLMLALLDVFVKLNTVKALINDNKFVSNNIVLYVDWLHLVSLAILRLTFMYGMAFKECNFANLLSKLQDGNVVSHTHKEYISPAVKLLCTVSLLICLFISVFGLDVIHYAIVKKEGWSMHDVFLQREYDTIMAFTRFREWDKNATRHVLNTPISNASDWTPLNIILGSTGIASSFCSLLLDNSVSDLVLITAIMLVIIAKGMRLGEGDQICRNMNPAETNGIFNDLVKEFRILTELSECMNAIVGNLVPLLVAVDSLAIVAMLQNILSENYSGTFVYAFRLAKDGLAMYMATSVNVQVSN